MLLSASLRFRRCSLRTLCAVIFLQGVITAQAEDDPRQHLIELWKSQTDSVTTAEISLRAYQCAAPVREFTEQSLHEFLETLSLEEGAAGLDRERAAFVPNDTANLSHHWGVPVKMVYSGSKVRESWLFNKDESHYEDTTVFDDKYTIHSMQANRQVSVFSGRTPTYIIQLSLLLFSPYVGHIDNPAQFSIENQGDGVVLLREGSQRIQADEKTGFVYRCTSFTPAGQAVHDVIQHGPGVHPDGAVIPRTIVQVRYGQDGGIVTFDAYCIETAALNVDIAEEAFAVKAEPDMIIVDFRHGTKYPIKTIVNAPIADVATYVEINHSPLEHIGKALSFPRSDLDN